MFPKHEKEIIKTIYEQEKKIGARDEVLWGKVVDKIIEVLGEGSDDEEEKKEYSNGFPA